MATKSKKKKSKKRQSTKSLSNADIATLGRMLCDVGNAYPLKFVTEKDFYPPVRAYLHGRVPGVETEVSVKHGEIDFKINKTTNPTYIELAVTARDLVDAGVSTPIAKKKKGKKKKKKEKNKTKGKTELYGSQNASELKKLSRLTGRKYILLLDLRSSSHDLDGLKESYKKLEAGLPGAQGITVVYVPRKGEPTKFTVKKRS